MAHAYYARENDVETGIAYQNQRIDERIANYRKYIEEAESERAEYAERARLACECYQKLKDAGFEPYAYANSVDVRVEVSDLPKLYRAIGSVKMGSKGVDDAKARTVRVYLKSARYPDLGISYTKKLPRKAGKCRIVTTRHTSAELVCEI